MSCQPLGGLTLRQVGGWPAPEAYQLGLQCAVGWRSGRPAFREDQYPR